MPRILFVSGFHPSTRARDLAYEFERFGPLLKPVSISHHLLFNPLLYAVDPRSTRDDVAPCLRSLQYDTSESERLHIKNDFVVDTGPLARGFIVWAKNPPSSVWRYDRRSSPPHRTGGARERSRSPRRRPDPRDERDLRNGGGDRDRDFGGDRDRDVRDSRDRRRRSRTPDRRRSPSPVERRRGDDRDRGARTPPLEEIKKDVGDRDRVPAQTPPYDH
ncbi:hypothetical protein BU15DRAFT_77504 [Melanogaster broomeanus]|nr:hypothetical protein BU15DRAFT_77504 [Melanogaster broomeanus]